MSNCSCRLKVVDVSSDNWSMAQQHKILLLKRVIPGLIGILALLPLSARPATWLTDLPSAQTAAKSENKLVLLNFTGSDWCGWCIRLRNEVFSKPEFDSYANDHLVLVEVDFPHHKAQSAEVKQANAALSRQFGIQGFPTLIVLDGDGKQVGALHYQPGGPQPFIAELSRLAARSATAPPPPPRQAKNGDFPPAPPPPLFNGAPTFPPQKFNDVFLKGVSGPKNNRLAVINNQTFAVGESANLKLGGEQLKVTCLEIRDDAVRVRIGASEERELRMRIKESSGVVK